jgi:hypothetical protein
VCQWANTRGSLRAGDAGEGFAGPDEQDGPFEHAVSLPDGVLSMVFAGDVGCEAESLGGGVPPPPQALTVITSKHSARQYFRTVEYIPDRAFATRLRVIAEAITRFSMRLYYTVHGPKRSPENPQAWRNVAAGRLSGPPVLATGLFAPK